MPVAYTAPQRQIFRSSRLKGQCKPDGPVVMTMTPETAFVSRIRSRLDASVDDLPQAVLDRLFEARRKALAELRKCHSLSRRWRPEER